MSAIVSSLSRQPVAEAPATGFERVVLQFGDHVSRGFTDRAAWRGQDSAGKFPSSIQFQALGSTELERVSLDGLKAAFFVKRFDGPGLDEMRFHDQLNPQANLWVRVIFQDGEVIEGLVANDSEFVLESGFLLTPTDPDANHWLIYVAKGQLREFQVLGLRSGLKS